MESVTEAKPQEQPLLLEQASMKGELDTLSYRASAIADAPSSWRRHFPSPLLLIFVVLPLLGSVLYNFVLASERYVSTASFVVRQNRSGSGVMTLIDGNGLSRSDDSSYAVVDYVTSRDAAGYVNRDGFLDAIFSGDNVDVFSRYPSILAGNTREDLFQHFQQYLSVDFDTSTGITTLAVQAFTPTDARELAQRLVSGSEVLVNTLNKRAQADAVRFAESVVKESAEHLDKLQQRMTEYRSQSKVLSVDAEVEVSSGLLSALMQEQIKVQTQLSQLSASAPNSPRVKELRLRQNALESQLAGLRENLAGAGNSVVSKIEGYEAISLQKDIAEKNLVNASATLLKAHQDSLVNRIYVDSIVSPNVSDKYGYPQKFFNTLMVLFVGFSAFIIARSARDLIMEDH